MKEDRLPLKRVRILCQMGLIAVSLVPLVVKDVFADVTTDKRVNGSGILLVKNMEGNEMNENEMSETTELYETIFKRKSIRAYDLTPLDVHMLAKVIAHVSALTPLHDGIKIEMKLLSQKDAKGLFLAKAPHYLAVFSEAKEGYLTNVGFVLQQMDLFFSANGIGSCWQGMPKPTKEILSSSKLEFVILLAFGKPKERFIEKAFRNSRENHLGR